MSLASSAWNAARNFVLPAGIAATMALAGTGMTAKTAYARPDATTVAIPSETAPSERQPLLSKRECGMLLGVASATFQHVGQGKDKRYNPEFPKTLAAFIAPSGPKPIEDIIVAGSFSRIARSQKPEDLNLKRKILPTITCSGEPYIIIKGHGIDMFNTIKQILFAGDNSLALDEKGVIGITPEAYALRRPGPQSDARPRPVE